MKKDDELAFSSWDEFDHSEYVYRNYGQRILHEDEQIIEAFSSYAKKYDMPLKSLKNVIDIGAGPNLYPGMLLMPYCAEEAKFTLADYSNANLTYLNLLKQDSKKARHIWAKFEKLMIDTSGTIYHGALENLLNQVSIKKGDVYKLEKEKYDAIISFFVTESITNELENFISATETVLAALTDGGYLIAAHMIGSEGYDTGAQTSFPAVSLSPNDLKKMYARSSVVDLEIYAFNHDSDQAAREGYTGMALVILKKCSE